MSTRRVIRWILGIAFVLQLGVVLLCASPRLVNYGHLARLYVPMWAFDWSPYGQVLDVYPSFTGPPFASNSCQFNVLVVLDSPLPLDHQTFRAQGWSIDDGVSDEEFMPQIRGLSPFREALADHPPQADRWYVWDHDYHTSGWGFHDLRCH